MRSPPTVIAVLALSVLCGHALGNPTWESTIAAPGTYDVTWAGPMTGVGSDWVYSWDLTFNGYPNGSEDQFLRVFVVYDDYGTEWIGGNGGFSLKRAMEKDPNILLQVWDEGAGAFEAMTGGWTISCNEPFVAINFTDADPSQQSRILMGSRFHFQATFTGELATPDKHAVHIGNLDDAGYSLWANNTPELGTWALLLLGLPVALRQWRRRKS